MFNHQSPGTWVARSSAGRRRLLCQAGRPPLGRLPDEPRRFREAPINCPTQPPAPSAPPRQHRTRNPTRPRRAGKQPSVDTRGYRCACSPASGRHGEQQPDQLARRCEVRAVRHDDEIKRLSRQRCRRNRRSGARDDRAPRGNDRNSRSGGPLQAEKHARRAKPGSAAALRPFLFSEGNAARPGVPTFSRCSAFASSGANFSIRSRGGENTGAAGIEANLGEQSGRAAVITIIFRLRQLGRPRQNGRRYPSWQSRDQFLLALHRNSPPSAFTRAR